MGFAGFGADDEGEVAFAERRQRELNASAAVIVAGGLEASLAEGTFDRSFHLHAGDGMTVRAA